jgi:hypothetical protein
MVQPVHWFRKHGSVSQALQLPLLVIVLLVSLVLSGCVQCDIAIQFDHASQGRIVQRVQVSERLNPSGGATTQQWLAEIERRSRHLGGRVERLPGSALMVTIPFSNQHELEARFNEFFNPLEERGSAIPVKDLPQVESRLQASRNNFLLVERNWLQYDLDLRSLGILSTSGDLILSPGSLIDLEFRLNTPWGARSASYPSIQPEVRQGGKELVWQLVPGELNHLEAVFWLPSPLGIGALVIALLVITGIYLRYPQRFYGKSPSPTQAASSKPNVLT